MLIGFSVSNYKSFKDRQKISFLASKIVRHKEHVSQVVNKRILRSGIIFGANAGGKSNLINAVDFSREIILNGLDKVNLSKCHFRVDSSMYKQPAVFEYRIVVNAKEYSYGLAISYKDKVILGEWLIGVSSSGEETYLFNREVDDNNISHAESEIEFIHSEDKSKMKFLLDGFAENISESYQKKTILCDIALRVNEVEGVFAEIKGIYNWFKNIVIIFPDTRYNGLNDDVADDNKKLFFSRLMNYFDTGIESVDGESHVMDLDKLLENISKGEAEEIKIYISNRVDKHPIMCRVNEQFLILHKDENGNIVYNKMLSNHGNSEDLFDYVDESDGTQRLFDLIPLLYKNRKDSIILIDEIDRSLHSKLTMKFLDLFYEKSKNGGCQLLATTHDLNLLNLDLLRQDEIWFVERGEDHSSTIYSLNKYRERFDKKIDREYMLGRYGAIPIFDSMNVLEEFYE